MFKKIEEKILKNLLLEITDKYDQLLRHYSSINTELKSIKYYDDLTNTFSKEGFTERLKDFLEKAEIENQQVAVIVVDIDNFKYINDVYGHGIGDIYLSRVASLIKEILPPNGIVGRLSGNSFIIAIYNSSFKDYIMFIEEILEKISSFSLKFGKSLVKTTASVGIAIYPQDGTKVNQLITLAEQAMYVSKNKGKNTYTLFNKEINKEFISIEKVRLMLNKVIHDESVVPYVQPILDIQENRMLGGEILLRVNFNGNIIPAGKFINVAEQFGFIDTLEDILFKKLEEKEIFRFFNGKKLFFNKTIKSEEKAIKTVEFVKKLKNYKDRYNFYPVIEITESSFVEYFSIIKKFISEARDMKSQIALDDFGAGYASFSYLLNFDIDILKIDGSLIKNIKNNKRSLSIVKAISQIAKDFNLKTVAEFVEDSDTLEILKNINIDYAQGYYISEPIPVERFIEILK